MIIKHYYFSNLFPDVERVLHRRENQAQALRGLAGQYRYVSNLCALFVRVLETADPKLAALVRLRAWRDMYYVTGPEEVLRPLASGNMNLLQEWDYEMLGSPPD